MSMDEKKKRKAVRAAEVTGDVAGGVFITILRALLTVFLVILTTGMLFMCIFAFYVKTCLADDLDISLSDFKLSESSKILYQDSNGNWQELCTLASEENRIWVDYEEIPVYLEKAAVAIEDKRFYTHKGVDWYRTVGAFVNMFVTMKDDFGGSTITQQLIKNVTRKGEDITVQRKLLEIFQALDLEKRYDKQEIVEWYLNAIYFGEGCYGVCTAADMYFGKQLSELTLAECASIIAITNNPSKYDPFVSESNNKDRQETILRCMYEQEMIDFQTYTDAVNEQLVFTRSDNEEYSQYIYSYYEETVINDVVEGLAERKGINNDTARSMLSSGGYLIYSCYDAKIQAAVDSIYQNVDSLPKPYYASDQQLQSAIVIMDPFTGEIQALSGGVGEKTGNYVLNRIDSQRPAGSSIKPLSAYGPALEYGLITQNTLVDDSPDIELRGTWWYPRNAGGGYSGIITIRAALIGSINTVAAQIVDKLGVSASYDYLINKLGFTTLVPDDESYAPLALGQFTNGVTVREMTQAYCSFVNEGVMTYSRTYTKVTDSDGTLIMDNPAQTIVSWKANTAANILNMLQAAVSQGTGAEAYLSSTAVAGKTGTTTDNWDRWFAGMTEYYVAVVWTGYDLNGAMYFNGNPAAQIWRKVMSQVLEGLDYKDFPYPAYIGGDTQIFGDLTEELEEQENPSESPEEDETAPSESPTDTGGAETSPDSGATGDGGSDPLSDFISGLLQH